MHVFVTGATGFIGSRVVSKLIGAGNTVVGMTRSDAGAATLEAMGAEAYWASLEDPESVAHGAARADAVIHTALDPTFPRSASERAAAEVAANGGSVAIVRLPQVHDTAKQGLVTFYVELARQAGVCGYVDEGGNRWCAAHVDDVAMLYRLALEQHQPGARWHGVAEEGVAIRAIAEVVGASLDVPAQSMTQEEAGGHFGWRANFIAADMTASSAITRARLGWRPSGPSLLDDIRAMDDSNAAARF